MSDLLEAQFTFTKNIAQLILWCFDNGFGVTLGEGYDDDNTGHMKGSLHYIRLAQDLNLFKDGVLLRKTEEYQRAGEAWKQLHSLNAWGGEFKDGNHFSFKYGGRK